MKKHYETYVEDTDKLISVAGPVLDYKFWYEQYRKLMEEQAQRKHGLYTHTEKGSSLNTKSFNVLWECIQGHTTQENWKPSMATASLWKVVDEEHKGTIEDPIIYIPPMEIFKDKYYIQNGIKYKCTRNSEQPLIHDLSALVGLYVETT